MPKRSPPRFVWVLLPGTPSYQAGWAYSTARKAREIARPLLGDTVHRYRRDPPAKPRRKGGAEVSGVTPEELRDQACAWRIRDELGTTCTLLLDAATRIEHLERELAEKVETIRSAHVRLLMADRSEDTSTIIDLTDEARKLLSKSLGEGDPDA